MRPIQIGDRVRLKQHVIAEWPGIPERKNDATVIAISHAIVKPPWIYVRFDECDCTQQKIIHNPGCGLGGLDWEKEVKPLISPILDDRFVILTPE